MGPANCFVVAFLFVQWILIGQKLTSGRSEENKYQWNTKAQYFIYIPYPQAQGLLWKKRQEDCRRQRLGNMEKKKKQCLLDIKDNLTHELKETEVA